MMSRSKEGAAAVAAVVRCAPASQSKPIPFTGGRRGAQRALDSGRAPRSLRPSVKLAWIADCFTRRWLLDGFLLQEPPIPEPLDETRVPAADGERTFPDAEAVAAG